MTVTALLIRVKAAGFEVYLDRGQPQLRRVVDGAELPPALLPDLRECREQIIAHLTPNPLVPRQEYCPVCEREVDDEYKQVLRFNFVLCDRTGSADERNENGLLVREARARCPFKLNPRGAW